MTHIHNRPRATKTSPTLRQDATKSWLTYHQYNPPNQDRTHNLQHRKTGDTLQTQCQDMMETPSKHHDDTHRYPQPNMSPTFCNANPKVPKMSQNEAETAKHEPNCSASQKFRHLYNFHFHTLFIMFIRSKFPLMPLGMPCTSACAAP